MTRVLQGFPAHFEQHALLRIHADRFPARNAEEWGIEGRDIREKTSPLGRHASRNVSVGIVVSCRVPAFRGNLGNRVAPLFKQLPERFETGTRAWDAAPHSNNRDGFGALPF